MQGYAITMNRKWTVIMCIKTRLSQIPTALSGLALGVAGLGACWEHNIALNGYAQLAGATFAALCLVTLIGKFILHHRLLLEELAHPVAGSVIPTFAMAMMLVSAALARFLPAAGQCLWLTAIVLHLIFLLTFAYHRLRDISLHHMVPSWFVPPVGIVVADIAYPGTPALFGVAHFALYFGLGAYALMLPVMIYRFIFAPEVPDAAKPTLAILAAPASLSLTGYLSIEHSPSPVIIALLFGIAVLMTFIIYFAMIRLLRLPFSPAYAAFTFPLVISATAMFKVAEWVETLPSAVSYAQQIQSFAQFELWVATTVVTYVALRYAHHLFMKPTPQLLA